MLKKENLFTIILILIYSVSFSQEELGSFKNELKQSSSFIKDVIPITNSKNNDVVVFFSDPKNVYGYKLNNKFEVTSKITSEEKRRKYKTLLGYAIPNEDNYKVVLTNKGKNKFLIVDFYFNENKTTTKEFVLDNASEKIIQTVSFDNKFYLITAIPFIGGNYSGQKSGGVSVSPNGDIINFYTIGNDNNLIKKEIDISEHPFIDKAGKRIKVRTLLTRSSTLFSKSNNTIPKIDSRVSNVIDITAKTEKLYLKDNILVFSFDKNNEFTQLLEINLNDYTVKKETYPKNLPDAKRSNSFILDKEVLVASSTKKELLVEIFDSESKEVLKKFNIYADKEITFKNSPIIQKGGAYANYRELKTAKQFLRKITADKFGISILKNADNYKFSIGGNSPKPNGGAAMPGFGGMPIGGIGGPVSLFFNPTMFAYNSSVGTKSTQIDCLLDLNFEHIEGEIPQNSFDKINDFLDREENDITEVFKQGDQIILGSYDKKSKKYYFYKF